MNMKAFNDRFYPEKTTLGESLELWAGEYKERTAIVEGERRISYASFNRQVNVLASGFKEAGLKKGEHVMVQLPNRSSFIFTCFALFRLGVVPVLVRPAHREGDLRPLIEKSEPVAFVTAEKYQGYRYEDLAKSLYDRYEFLKYVFMDGSSRQFTSLQDIAGDDFHFDGPAYNDIGLITLSGGTTGIPKLIPRSHGDYIYNIKMAAKRSEVGKATVFLAALPVSHGFAFANPGILGTFHSGGTVVLASNASPDEILPLIEREKVTMVPLVPTAAQLCLETLSWDDSHDISSLEAVLIGGSVLEESLARRIIGEMGCRLQQVYGMSEGLICMTPLNAPDEVAVSCQGKPISEYDEIRIVDEALQPVPQGEFGELVTKGPYTIHGYYNAPEANAESFTPDGYYRTGDRARLTGDGDVVVVGRIKDRINRGGEKITPSEVESYLLRYPGIRECVVLGVPDEVLGQSIFAFVMCEAQEVNLTGIHEFLLGEGIATYKLPDNMEVIDIWPLTSVGKIDKTKLLRMAVEIKK